MASSAATDLGTLWTLQKDTRTARCRVVTHPLGLEIRVAIDGHLVSSRVFRESAKLIKQSRVSREVFEQDGWRV